MVKSLDFILNSMGNPWKFKQGIESESEVAQLCPALCNPMDCSLPGSSVHGIFQARIREWGAIAFSRGSSQSRDWTQVSRIVGRHFIVWATREGHIQWGMDMDVQGLDISKSRAKKVSLVAIRTWSRWGLAEETERNEYWEVELKVTVIE